MYAEPYFTKRDFDSIKLGMNMNKVKEIIGDPVERRLYLRSLTLRPYYKAKRFMYDLLPCTSHPNKMIVTKWVKVACTISTTK